MVAPRGTRRADVALSAPMTRLLRLVVGLGAIVLCLLISAAPASAHPLGNFTVNRYTGILVSADGVEVDHVVDLAEIPTAQLGKAIEDLPVLAERECGTSGRGLDLNIAGTLVPLELKSSSATTAPGAGGLPITRITCAFAAAVDIGSGEVTFEDRTSPGSVGWREVTAVGNGMTLDSADVPAESTSGRLTKYPKDLLQSPLNVTSATLLVSPGGPAGVLPGSGSDATPSANNGGWLSARATALLGDNGFLAAGLAVLAAIALGASHALSPGHGKTVMAFYLSQRGDSSLRSALAVGSAVTAAHTGSVLLLGLLVSLSSAFVPARIYPYLTVATGLLIVGLGLYLLVRLRSDGERGHGHGHGNGHGHGHGHSHEGHGHADGDDHRPDGDPRASVEVATVESRVAVQSSDVTPGRGGVWVMGLVGGLVPSPSALLLLLAALAVGRAWFGFVLVLAFGIGMAVSLAAVGLLARGLVLRLESLASRRGFLGGNVRTFLRYGAALGICAVGTGVVVRAVLRL